LSIPQEDQAARGLGRRGTEGTVGDRGTGTNAVAGAPAAEPARDRPRVKPLPTPAGPVRIRMDREAALWRLEEAVTGRDTWVRDVRVTPDGNIQILLWALDEYWEIIIRSDYQEATEGKVLTPPPEVDAAAPAPAVNRGEREAYVKMKRDLERLRDREALLRRRLPEIAPTMKDIDDALRDSVRPKKYPDPKALVLMWKLIKLHQELDALEAEEKKAPDQAR
jgi:hypothetical protein